MEPADDHLLQLGAGEVYATGCQGGDIEVGRVPPAAAKVNREDGPARVGVGKVDEERHRSDRDGEAREAGR